MSHFLLVNLMSCVTTVFVGIVPVTVEGWHDYVIKWKHFPRYWPFVRGIHLRRYLQYFSMEQIHVVDGNTFGKYPWKELALVENFLNIDPYLSDDKFSFNATKGFYCLKTSSGEACLGKNKGRTHPDVNSTLIEKLKQFYRPHNEELFKMLDKRFEW